MRDYMFRNRWGALLFVGLTLAGVTTLVGTDKNNGALQQAALEIERQQAQAEKFAKDPGGAKAPQDEDDEANFISDEELIDPATGEDPTPVDQTAPVLSEEGETIPVDEVIIVSREIAGQGPAPIEVPQP